MAKNLMADVAKLLGVELGEKFAIENWDDDDELFEFDVEYGLGCYQISQNSSQFGDRSDLFYDLIMGYEKIVKLPWKPQKDKEYFYPNVELKQVWKTRWQDLTFDYAIMTLNMCYRTKAEAEAHFAEDYKKLTGKELS